MYLVIILAGLLTFAFYTFPFSQWFVVEIFLRSTVAGTVRDFRPIPFSFQMIGNQNFCKYKLIKLKTKNTLQELISRMMIEVF